MFQFGFISHECGIVRNRRRKIDGHYLIGTVIINIFFITIKLTSNNILLMITN